MGLEIFDKYYQCDGQISIEEYLNENVTENEKGEEENGEK